MLTNLWKANFLMGLNRPGTTARCKTKQNKPTVRKSTRPPTREWFPAAIKLPAILETVDNLLEENSCNEIRLSEVIKDLEKLRVDILDDLRNYTSQSKLELDMTTIADLRGTEDYSAVDEHRFILRAGATTFPTTYRFHGFQHACRNALTWLACLLLDCTLLRILKQWPFVRLFPTLRRPADKIQENAFALARDICRSIYYFSGRWSLAHAHFTAILLEVVTVFFEEIHAYRELAWSEACRAALKIRVKRMEAEGQRTRCRVGSVPTSLADAARFRTFDVHSTKSHAVPSQPSIFTAPAQNSSRQ